MTAPDALLTDLRAALDKEERVARGATQAPWQEIENVADWMVVALDAVGTEVTGSGLPEADAAHIAARDPKWTLRLIARDGETLDRHAPVRDAGTLICRNCVGGESWPCADTRARARVWLTDDQLRAHGIER